jgi:hypothetical protein
LEYPSIQDRLVQEKTQEANAGIEKGRTSKGERVKRIKRKRIDREEISGK